MECIYCKKSNHISRRCFFKKLHKQSEPAEDNKKSEIKIWRTIKGKTINKSYHKGRLLLNTKHKIEKSLSPTIELQNEKQEQKIKEIVSNNQEPEIIELDITEEDVQFIKSRSNKQQDRSQNTVRTETIEPSISTCNVLDHQTIHKKLRMLEDKNKKLQIEVHNWKKHYLKTHMELMDNIEKGQTCIKNNKCDLKLNKETTPVMDNIPSIPSTRLISKVRPLNS